MRKFSFTALACLLFWGCFVNEQNDNIIAKIGNVEISSEDLAFYLNERKLTPESKDYEEQVHRFVQNIMIANDGEKNFPGIKTEADEHMVWMNNRILTSVYQRFHALEGLFYPEDSLMSFYQKNLNSFKEGELVKAYKDVRGEVAEALYISDHESEFNAFVQRDMDALSTPEAPADEESVRISSRKKFFNAVRENIINTTGERLVKKYDLSIVEDLESNERSVYDADPSRWMVQPGLYVYQMQFQDSVRLSGFVKNVKTLDDFKTAVRKHSSHKLTAKRDGELGWVLKDHALPYGIGVFPELFDLFPGDSVGISPIVRCRNTPGQFMVFFVTAHKPAEQKTFERAKHAISLAILNGDVELPPDVPVVKEDGRPVVFERDLQKLRKEQRSDKKSRRVARKQHTAMLMEWYAFAKEALALRLDTTSAYRTLKKSVRTNYVRFATLDSLASPRKLTVEQAVPYYEKYGRGFPGKKIDEILQELSYLAVLTERDIRYEYFYQKPVTDASEDYIAELEKYIPYLKTRAELLLVRRFVRAAEKNNEFVWTLESPKVVVGESAEQIMVKADSLKAIGKKNEASWNYNYIRIICDDDSLYLKSSVVLAQSLVDDENYENAIKEYSVVFGMFPNSLEGERALFNIGFILDENLNRKADAKIVYQRFLDKYPKSELAESVSWLLKNVESDGKLAEELIEKIEKAE